MNAKPGCSSVNDHNSLNKSTNHKTKTVSMSLRQQGNHGFPLISEPLKKNKTIQLFYIMTTGLLQTQIQNKLRFKSLFSKHLSLYTIPFDSTLISVFHTWNNKLYRHRRGKVYINKSQLTQSLPAYQCFKGALDIKHAISEIFKMRQML